MTEDIMNEIENHMALPYADDDPIDEPKEQDGDELYDQQRADNDYADLHATLFSIGKLQTQISRIDRLVEKLQGSSWAKPQG